MRVAFLWTVTIQRDTFSISRWIWLGKTIWGGSDWCLRRRLLLSILAHFMLECLWKMKAILCGLWPGLLSVLRNKILRNDGDILHIKLTICLSIMGCPYWHQFTNHSKNILSLFFSIILIVSFIIFPYLIFTLCTFFYFIYLSILGWINTTTLSLLFEHSKIINSLPSWLLFTELWISKTVPGPRSPVQELISITKKTFNLMNLSIELPSIILKIVKSGKRPSCQVQVPTTPKPS